MERNAIVSLAGDMWADDVIVVVGKNFPFICAVSPWRAVLPGCQHSPALVAAAVDGLLPTTNKCAA